MAVIDVADLKSHLNITNNADDALIGGKIEAAQAAVEQMLGFAIEDRFSSPPGDLKEAVRQLAAHFYENREASVVAVSASLLPLGVSDLVRNRRDWALADG